MTAAETLTGVPTTDDMFLGGLIRISQPREGYRAGTDAVLLAALITPRDADAGPILDVGSGAGTVGLCVAARCPDAKIVLLEREPHLIDIASENVTRNNFSARVRIIKADIERATDALAQAGIASETFATVLANPPYYDKRRSTASTIALKANAHQMPDDGLEIWARFMCRMARPGGRVAMINHVSTLPIILAAFEGRFGALSVLPVYAREGEPAIRVIVEGIKGSRAPLSVKPGLILHGPEQDFLPRVDAIFRRGAALFETESG